MDPEGGKQPIVYEDAKYSVCANGEIYNFRQLRQECGLSADDLRTSSDTEVLLAAWERWGEKCLPRLVGQFAFALYDRVERRIWLVRDRFGEKPLFYHDDGKALVFASSLHAVLQAPWIRAEVDDELLYRKAKRLGFDRDDPVVQRRLVQNMRFAGADPERDAASLYAEALDLGMHESDPVVRRRLVQRMRLAIEAEALCPAVDMQGLGYSGGFDDGRGLGCWRGEEHLEHDVFDVSHPVDVGRPDGSTARPLHRIQPVRVAMRGAGLDSEGTGSLTLIAEGDLPQLGLGS